MEQRVEIKPKKRPLLSPRFVRSMLAGHSALGLAFAALIYVVCLTGTVCVFLHELQRWEQPDGPIIARQLTPADIGAAVNAAYVQATADNAAHDMFIMGPGPAMQRLFVGYHDHDTGREGEWLANAEGRLVARVAAPWSEFLGSLHMNLHLPRTWGLFIVGLTGVALLSSLISGLLSHPRIFKDAFFLRRGGSRRLQDADLHNRLGVWGLPFHVAVSLTGALLGLSTLIIGVLALAAYNGNSAEAFAEILGPRASADESAAPVPDVAAMMRHVLVSKPNATFSAVQIDHIGKAGQVVHLGMRTPGHLAMGNTYYFKGDGTPIGDGGLEEGGVGQQILGVLQPLHFGWFGGYPIKLAYGVLGLGLTIVTFTGVTIWLARRRDKGRPVPRWEKIWAAVGWGQPMALAMAAAISLYASEVAILPTYLTATGLALLIAFLAPNARITTRVLQIFAGLAIVGVATGHIAIWNGRASDPMGWIVDTVLFSIALAMLWPILAGLKTRASSRPAHA
jgi:uncharacterized iron-regulated membrane protein